MSTSLLKPQQADHHDSGKRSEAFAGSSFGLIILLLMFVAVALLWVAAIG